MPRNVATPEQAARAKSATTEIVNENKFLGTRPLTKMDRRVLQNAPPDVFVYNVSPIWQWNRPVVGRGEVVIQKRKADAVVSDPLEVPGALIRDYDAGNRVRRAYVEEGLDLVEDILCCSSDYPGMPQNNLTHYGVFYLVGKRLEDLPEEKQQEILFEANSKHDAKCREKVLEADQLWSNPQTKSWITDMYRQCALHVNEEREWVAKRGKPSRLAECPFCGWEHKPGLAKCPNCHEILDKKLYEKLKG